MLDKIVTDLREYYTERVSDGPTALTVGWKSTQAQLSRFDQLVRVIDHDDGGVPSAVAGLGVAALLA